MTDQQSMIDQIENTHKAHFEVRPITDADRPWVRDTLKRYWISTDLITRGRVHRGDALPGFAAWRGDTPVGLLLYDIQGPDCEIVTHNSLAGHGGVGSILLASMRQKARDAGCTRLWLITTNDNTPAMRFYQRRDFEIIALHRGALTEARKLKPGIPQVGIDGIAIRHEIELEYTL